MKETINDLKWREKRLINQLNEENKNTEKKEEIENLKVKIRKLQLEKDQKENDSTDLFNKGVQTGVALGARNKAPGLKSSGISLFHGNPMPVSSQQGAKLVTLQPAPIKIYNQHKTHKKVRFEQNEQYVQLQNQSVNMKNEDWEYFSPDYDEYYDEPY